MAQPPPSVRDTVFYTMSHRYATEYNSYDITCNTWFLLSLISAVKI